MNTYTLESTSIANAYLRQIAKRLRAAPGHALKTAGDFTKALGTTNNTRIQDNRDHRVAHGLHQWLGCYMHFVLPTGDVLLLNQADQSPTEEESETIEQLGGYLVKAHKGWGFLHFRYEPVVYLVPAEAVLNFYDHACGATRKPVSPYASKPVSA